jgi:hypothetical protein
MGYISTKIRGPMMGPQRWVSHWDGYSGTFESDTNCNNAQFFQRREAQDPDDPDAALTWFAMFDPQGVVWMYLGARRESPTVSACPNNV